jgi:hypothetical protein
MLEASSMSKISLQASATAGLATAEIARDDGYYCTAFAATQPERLPPLAEPCVFHDSQPAKHLPSQIFHAGREYGRISTSHDRSPVTRVVRTAMQLELRGRLSLYHNNSAM